MHCICTSKWCHDVKTYIVGRPVKAQVQPTVLSKADTKTTDTATDTTPAPKRQTRKQEEKQPDQQPEETQESSPNTEGILLLHMMQLFLL